MSTEQHPWDSMVRVHGMFVNVGAVELAKVRWDEVTLSARNRKDYFALIVPVEPLGSLRCGPNRRAMTSRPGRPDDANGLTRLYAPTLRRPGGDAIGRLSLGSPTSQMNSDRCRSPKRRGALWPRAGLLTLALAVGSLMSAPVPAKAATTGPTTEYYSWPWATPTRWEPRRPPARATPTICSRTMPQRFPTSKR